MDANDCAHVLPFVLAAVACGPSSGAADESTTTSTAQTAAASTGTDGEAGAGNETEGAQVGCEDPLSAVSDLFSARCTAPGCHAADGAAAGLVLEGDWSGALVAQPASLCDGRLLVAPGQPAASELWIRLGDQPDCGVRMPTGAASLSTDEIDCVASWIESVEATCETCGTTACVDTDSDAANCGACGVACPEGVACHDGGCICPGGGQVCGDGCVDTNANGDHCGGCDSPCDGGLLCLAGDCVDDCGGLTQCGNACVDITSDPLHCGGCDTACTGAAACIDSACDCGPSVSFAADVEPILVADCTSMGCHGFPMPKEELDLRAGSAYAELVSVDAQQCANRLLVAPGAPEDSYLVDKILGVNMCSGNRMPKDPPPLSAADVDLINAWICQGAPDN